MHTHRLGRPNARPYPGFLQTPVHLMIPGDAVLSLRDTRSFRRYVLRTYAPLAGRYVLARIAVCAHTHPAARQL